MNVTPFPLGTRVEVVRNRRTLAIATVASDESDTTTRTLRLAVLDSMTERIYPGVISLSRPVDVAGEDGWTRQAYERISRLSVYAI